MKTIAPFENDSDSLNLGELTIENGTDRVVLYGSLTLTKDKAGLARARALSGLLGSVVRALEAEKDLPDEISPAQQPEQVRNPFE